MLKNGSPIRGDFALNGDGFTLGECLCWVLRVQPNLLFQQESCATGFSKDMHIKCQATCLSPAGAFGFNVLQWTCQGCKRKLCAPNPRQRSAVANGLVFFHLSPWLERVTQPTSMHGEPHMRSGYELDPPNKINPYPILQCFEQIESHTSLTSLHCKPRKPLAVPGVVVIH